MKAEKRTERTTTEPTGRSASLGPSSAQARGVSGALHVQQVGSQARQGRWAGYLPSECPTSGLPTGSSGFHRFWSGYCCPAKGRELPLEWKARLLSAG